MRNEVERRTLSIVVEGLDNVVATYAFGGLCTFDIAQCVNRVLFSKIIPHTVPSFSYKVLKGLLSRSHVGLRAYPL